MKKFLIALNIVIWSFVGYQATAFAADEAPKTKQICVDHFKLVELDLPKNNHFK